MILKPIPDNLVAQSRRSCPDFPWPHLHTFDILTNQIYILHPSQSQKLIIHFLYFSMGGYMETIDDDLKAKILSVVSDDELRIQLLRIIDYEERTLAKRGEESRIWWELMDIPIEWKYVKKLIYAGVVKKVEEDRREAATSITFFSFS